MGKTETRYQPGQVRDAILQALSSVPRALSVTEIQDKVRQAIGDAPSSSIRSYLRLNTPTLFTRESRGCYRLQDTETTAVRAEAFRAKLSRGPVRIGAAKLYHEDCFDWLAEQPNNTIHAVVTDPPYGLHEYSKDQQSKLRTGKGGVWRIPPSYDGHVRSPLPRFTTLTSAQLDDLHDFFHAWGRLLLRKLVPGAHVVVASNPLVSYIVAAALALAGLERRGEIIRLVMTMRGGDRPKGAHEQFPEVSVMPRSMWEPWLVYRKPFEDRVQDNLRNWGTGGFRRPCEERPFGDVIQSSPTQKQERALAPHPSLKPQAFLRQVVRGVLPLGRGVVLDPFAGAGSTLAAAEAIGYESIGIEQDKTYFEMACEAIPKLKKLRCRTGNHAK